MKGERTRINPPGPDSRLQSTRASSEVPRGTALPASPSNEDTAGLELCGAGFLHTHQGRDGSGSPALGPGFAAYSSAHGAQGWRAQKFRDFEGGRGRVVVFLGSWLLTTPLCQAQNLQSQNIHVYAHMCTCTHMFLLCINSRKHVAKRLSRARHHVKPLVLGLPGL